jgi:hypothetical protein
MSSPLVPQPRASAPESSVAEPANEPAFATETATSAAPASAGWDPYEVWRTRVFTPQTAASKKA